MAIRKRGNRIDFTGKDANESTMDQVIKRYPKAYATFGMEMFTNREFWRIEDGNGVVLASRADTEDKAWDKALKTIK